MKGAGDRILYIGKAINLRSRINQYLGLQDSREMVPRLVRELLEIEFILTNSEKEALILERQLVRKLKPKYNVLLRDDKNFLMVRVDFTQEFPRFELVRRRKKDGATYFGPYTMAKVLRTYVRFLSRAFRLRVCSDKQMKQRLRPCMFYQTGGCSCPCIFPEENQDYAERLQSAVDLLTTNRREALAMMEQVMMKAADNERFEDAARFRDLMRAMSEIWGKQHVTIAMPLDADVFAVHHGPMGGAVYVLHIRDSSVVGSNSFFNEVFYSPEVCDLESVAFQYYGERPSPATVIGEFKTGNLESIASLLTEEAGKKVAVLHPRRGAKRALLDMARTNAAQVYEKECETALVRHDLLSSLAAALHMAAVPEVVECIDISSFQGGDAVGSVSVARDGVLVSSEYRCFHIKGNTDSDIDMMAEVVSRRIKQLSSATETRVMLLDGGRAHLARCAPLVPEGAPIFPAAIAKARPEQGLAHERLYVPGDRTPVAVEPDSRIMLFVASLRDEAHRFGVKFHRKTRAKRVLTSPLLSIPGVGKKRRLQLVKHFGSFAKVKEASINDLMAVPGFPRNLARRVHEFFDS